jgi:hypothetical protein
LTLRSAERNRGEKSPFPCLSLECFMFSISRGNLVSSM